MGYLQVFDHLYHTITDPQGTFSIPNLPPGTHSLAIWHKTLDTIHQPIALPQKNKSILTIEFPLPPDKDVSSLSIQWRKSAIGSNQKNPSLF